MDRVQLLFGYMDRLIALGQIQGRMPDALLKECGDAIREELGLIQPVNLSLSVNVLINQLEDPGVQDKVKRIIESALADALATNG